MIELADTDLSPKLSSIGGGTLEQHWLEGTEPETPRNLIESGEYDLLILQGRYDIHRGDQYVERFNTYVDQFSALAKENNMRVLLYGLWATDNWISPEKDIFGPVAHDIYRAAAERNAISYAPNGLAYNSLYGQLANTQSEQEIEATMTQDSVHPSPTLAYLAANVVYYTLFGKESPPTSIYLPPGITYETGEMIRAVAIESVIHHGYSWR